MPPLAAVSRLSSTVRTVGAERKSCGDWSSAGQKNGRYARVSGKPDRKRGHDRTTDKRFLGPCSSNGAATTRTESGTGSHQLHPYIRGCAAKERAEAGF